MQWAELQPLLRHFSLSDQRNIERSFRLASELHAGQLRRSGDPYFSHPAAVAAMLAAMNADRDTIIAALLHDAVEDTPITLKEIDDRFDGAVASLIEGVTKLCSTDVGESPKLNEQIETLRKMFTLMERDVRVMVIKLVDRLHNMRTAEYLSPERRRALAQETMDVYVKIADRLCLQDLRYELEELCLSILQPSLFEQLIRLRDESQRKSSPIITLMRESLLRSHAPLFHRVRMLFEPKAWNKLHAQLEAKGAVITGLSSITVTFICPDRDACYQVLGALHATWRQEALSFQDYINAPVESGYQGLHTTIILGDGTRVRCKIRTEEMEEYFHRGVCTFCFKPEMRESLRSLLPWTRQLPTLTQETRNRSLDFWESLQSDILGETITIHGPNDQTAKLPKGATALDGAFYLFGERALFLHSLRVNGQGVVFGSALQNGVSVDPSFAEQPVVRREWMEHVQTRYSIALIRGAISEESEEERLKAGKAILQRTLTERKRGFVEELNVHEVEERLHPLGLTSLTEALIAIADGRVEPLEVFDAIFSSQKKKEERAKTVTVQYTMNLRNTDIMDRLIRIHRKFASGISEIRYIQPSTQHGVTQLKATFQSKQLRELMEELTAAGAKNVGLAQRTPTLRITLGFIVLILLWGLDPVIARSLIQQFDLTAIDFTLIRFWSLAIVFLAGTSLSRRRSILQPLRLRNPLLWLSAAFLIIVALTTYAALREGTATHYETIMTASGLLVATVFHSLPWRKGATLWFLFACTLFLLTRSTTWDAVSGFFTLISFGSFAAFLAVSSRYLRQEFIASRRLEYYTAMLSIGSLCTLPLFAFVSPAIRDPMTILAVSVFSLLFIGFPYYLYYELSPQQESTTVLPLAFIMLGATFVGELALTHHADLPTFLAVLVMMGLAFYQERNTHENVIS